MTRKFAAIVAFIVVVLKSHRATVSTSPLQSMRFPPKGTAGAVFKKSCGTRG